MAIASLTQKESELLQFVARKTSQELSRLNDDPNMRVVNSLVRKGMLQDIMGTFWKITPEGKSRLSLVENREPLPAGTVIDFSGEQAIVVSDKGGIGPLSVKRDGVRAQRWWWESGGCICTVVRMPGNDDAYAN